MHRWWRSFWAFYRQSLGIAMTYRVQSVLWMVGKTMPLVMLMIWLRISSGKSVGDFDPARFSLYYMFLFVAYQLTPIWAIYRMDQNIRQGNLAPQLMRPVDPMWSLVAEHWAEMSIRLPVITAIFFIGIFLTGVQGMVEWERLPLFILATFVGWWVTFTLHYALAALVFWTDSITHFDGLIYRLFIIFGGVAVPVTLFPDVIKDVVMASPFPYVFYFPARLMIGDVVGFDIVRGFAITLAWVVLFTILHRFLWRLGMKRFSAVGQ